jgi:hypothetical protein
MGVAVAPANVQSVRVLAERDTPTIVHWTRFSSGGHFAPVDASDELIGDLRRFFGSLETRRHHG